MLANRIALRYVLGLRKFSTTQILSLLALLGIFLGSMAMVVVLSAFNGFEGLLKEIYHHQDPDLKVSSKKGKTFLLDPLVIKKLKEIEEVTAVFQTVSDKASLQYGNGQMVVEIIGIEPDYEKFSRLDTLIRNGDFLVKGGEISLGLVTEPVRSALQISLKNDFELLQISYPKRKKILKLGTSKIFNQLNIRPKGFVQMDEQRVYAPIQDVRELMDKPAGISYLEIFLRNGENPDAAKSKIQKVLGDNFFVKNETEQHEDLFKILKIEKLFVFLALGFIILISSFNLFVSCSMMVIDKKKDLFTLLALGMQPSDIKKIIRISGWLVTLLGLIPGLIFGYGICLVQKIYGFVPLGMTSTIIQAYPIEIHGLDFVLIAIWVLLIGFLAVLNPASKAPALVLSKAGFKS
jgi:lipoprotein-releasing system permease protein